MKSYSYCLITEKILLLMGDALHEFNFFSIHYPFWKHMASTMHLHYGCFRNCCCCFRNLPWKAEMSLLFVSCSRFLKPWRFHLNSILVILLEDFLIVLPVHFHLLHLIWVILGWWCFREIFLWRYSNIIFSIWFVWWIPEVSV